MALAAALPEPWSDEEHGLIAMRERLVSDEVSHVGFGPGVGTLRYHLPEATQVHSTCMDCQLDVLVL